MSKIDVPHTVLDKHTLELKRVIYLISETAEKIAQNPDVHGERSFHAGEYEMTIDTGVARVLKRCFQYYHASQNDREMSRLKRAFQENLDHAIAETYEKAYADGYEDGVDDRGWDR